MPRSRRLVSGPVRVLGPLIGLALMLTLPIACANQAKVPKRANFAQTPAGQALSSQVITRRRAWTILAQLPPRDRAELRELMFLANLRSASGNEQSPLRIYRRIEKELAQPVVVSRATVARVLGDMARVIEMHPESLASPGSSGDDLSGYTMVSEMLESAEGAFPTQGECFVRINAFPRHVAAAFWQEEYYADHHYHAYTMREAILGVLVSGEFGAAPLEVYADYLRTGYPSRSANSTYGRVVRASQEILGPSFKRWFKEVRGRSFGWTMMRTRG